MRLECDNIKFYSFEKINFITEQWCCRMCKYLSQFFTISLSVVLFSHVSWFKLHSLRFSKASSCVYCMCSYHSYIVYEGYFSGCVFLFVSYEKYLTKRSVAQGGRVSFLCDSATLWSCRKKQVF